MTYAEHRLRRIWAAYQYEGWGMPPYPTADNPAYVHLGRVVMVKEPINSRYPIEPGFYPGLNPVIEGHYKAKEKRQNREKFDR
jgi:hypothetical protein